MAARSPTPPFPTNAMADGDALQEVYGRLQARLTDLMEENSQLLQDKENNAKKLRYVQQEVFEARQGYDRLEAQIYQKEQEVQKIQREVQSTVRIRRELQERLRKESMQYERDRQQWSEQEADLNAQIKRQAFDRRRFTVSGASRPAPADRNGPGAVAEEGDEEAGGETRDRQTLEVQRTLRNQERQIQELRGEVARLETARRNLEVCHDQAQARAQEQTQEVEEVKRVNQTLMEDNEAYQLLLHEKTVNGNFSLGALGYDHGTSQEGLASLAAELSPVDAPELTFGSPLTPGAGSGALDLAAELGRAASITSPDHEAELRARDDQLTKCRTDIKALEKDVKAARDENKALTLYINKILGRIMSSGMLQEVLAQDYTGKNKPNGDGSGPVTADSPNDGDPAKKTPGDDHVGAPRSGGVLIGLDDEDDGVDAMTRAARTAAKLRAQKERRRRSIDQAQSPPSTSPTFQIPTTRPGRSHTVVGATRPPPVDTGNHGAGASIRSVFSLLSPRSAAARPSTMVAHSPVPSQHPPPLVNHPRATTARGLTPEMAAVASWNTSDIEEEEEEEGKERKDKDGYQFTSSPHAHHQIPGTVTFPRPRGGDNYTNASVRPAEAGYNGQPPPTYGGGTGEDLTRGVRRHYSVSGHGHPTASVATRGSSGGGPEAQPATPRSPAPSSTGSSDQNSSGWKAAWRRMSTASPWKN
ncbi:hypothetical protein IWQ60_011522 [Tieghemiomyces parasiticus]|uniref:Uncharacterized protein n=1 Tax=Tieghemiomyces parasiticus TaxID=78921 RepID=A0A9W8DID3_9FUNG|nr:hypothetical protein IWQ60_011522 [Tieghemiomyces parasiticus]